MSIRSLPGHVFMHAFQISRRYQTFTERSSYLTVFGVEAGDDVYLYSGHSDLDNGCLMRFGDWLRDVRHKHSAQFIGRQLAEEIEPVVELVRQSGAKPILYGCLCHDDIKQSMARALGVTYIRCSACGGSEGEVVVRATPGRPRPGPLD